MSSSTTRRPRSRQSLAAGGALVALAALAALSGCGLAPGPGAARQTLAVMYFENLTDPGDGDLLGRMLTGLLTTELARTTGLEVVSQQRLYDAAAQLGVAGSGLPAMDRDQASAVARRVAADTMLIGRVVRAEELLVATVEMVDVPSGEVVASERVEGQEPEDIFGLVESLGRQLGPELRTDLPAAGDRRSLTTGLTRSVAAYRAYVTAEDLLHKKELPGAVAGFRDAVALDPEFALAHYRLSLAAAWTGDEAGALAAALRAVELADQLPPSLQDLVLAAAACHQGRYSQAIPLLEEVLAAEPDHKEALYLLSEMVLHSGLDTDIARGVEAMSALERLDPGFWLLRDHLILARVVEGRWQEAAASLDAWSADEPEMVAELRTFALALANRIDEIPELGEPIAGNAPFSLQTRGAAAILAGRWETARRLAAIEVEGSFLRAWHLRNRGTFHAYRGEFEAAAEAYRQAGAANVFGEHQGSANGIPGAALWSLAELQVLAGDRKAARHSAAAAADLQPENPGPRWYAGRLALLDGDRRAAEEHLEAVRQAAARSRGTLAALFAEALEAEILLADGRADEARDRYRRVVSSGALLDELFATYSSSGALFRDGLARAHRALWDQAGEAAALEGLIGSGFERLDHPVLYVRALYRLGELHLEAGDEARARASFDRFLDHWGDADWPLAEVGAARELTGR